MKLKPKAIMMNYEPWNNQPACVGVSYDYESIVGVNMFEDLRTCKSQVGDVFQLELPAKTIHSPLANVCFMFITLPNVNSQRSECTALCLDNGKLYRLRIIYPTFKGDYPIFDIYLF